MREAPSILVADDDAGRADGLRAQLVAEFPQAFVLVVRAAEALRATSPDAAWDLLVLGIGGSAPDGEDLVKALLQASSIVPVLVVAEVLESARLCGLLQAGATEAFDLSRGGGVLLPLGIRRALDHSELARRNATLESQLAQAEHASSINTLMAGIAHNLNNPLTTVQTFLDLLPERWECDPEFRGGFFSLVREEASRIQSLISSMMLAVTVPSGWRQEPWPLTDLFGELDLHARAQANGKALQFEFRAEAGLPQLVAAREAVKQALIILLDNAIAFSPPDGAISLDARRAEAAPGGALTIEVADQGPGVPAEQRERIFEPFFTTRSGGLGIGLFVARSVARVHGGVLQIRVGAGPGARFVLELPSARPGG